MARSRLGAVWLMAFALLAALSAGGCMAMHDYDDDHYDYESECDYRPDSRE